jgi:hypothetical protein
MDKQFVAGWESIFTIREFLTPAECEAHVARTEAVGYGDAPINSLGGPVVNKNMRNNERVMFDDRVLAADLWSKLQPLVPERFGNWRAVGLNERFRFYRYDTGQKFDWHYDGCFERHPLERSRLTFMIYLNDGFEGGATEFHLSRMDGFSKDDPVEGVVPEAGMALVFEHAILHQGSPVTSGRKYVLRSDVMYRYEKGA